MIRKLIHLGVAALLACLLVGCNENMPGDPDYYSCQWFGTHCKKHK